MNQLRMQFWYLLRCGIIKNFLNPEGHQNPIPLVVQKLWQFYWRGGFGLLVELHWKGSASEACTVGLFQQNTNSFHEIKDFRSMNSLESHIRHEDFHPVGLCLWRSGYPPWTLKWGGLKSSGLAIISSIGKNKKTSYFWPKKK